MSTADKIRLQCAGCGKVLNVGTHLAGKRGKCPGCGAAIDIPAAKALGAAPADKNPPPRTGREVEAEIQSIKKSRALAVRHAIDQLVRLTQEAGDSGYQALVAHLNDSDSNVRLCVADALRRLPVHPSAREPLLRALVDKDGSCHPFVAEVIGQFPDSRVVDALIGALAAPANNDIKYDSARCAIVKSLGKLGDLRAAPALARATFDISENVREEAGKALRQLVDNEEAERLLGAARGDPSAASGQLPIPLPPVAYLWGKVEHAFYRPPEQGRLLLAVPLGLLGIGLFALSLFGLFGLGDVFHGVAGLVGGGSLLAAAAAAARTRGRGKGHWFVAFDRGLVFTDGVEIIAVPWGQIAGISCQRQEGFVASVLNRQFLIVLHRRDGPALATFAPDDLTLPGFIDEKVRRSEAKPTGQDAPSESPNDRKTTPPADELAVRPLDERL